jgi:hypothetical protein
MALYVVRAKPIQDRLGSLRQELDSGEISRMVPFGEELHRCLLDARIGGEKDEDGGDGYAYWVEEDYCTPPLAMERRSVLDRYFEEIKVKPVNSREEGWDMIKAPSSLWGQTA